MITSINNENNLNLGKHCGKKTGQTALVTGDYAVLTFHTDEVEESKGFLLFFTTIPEGKLNPKTDQFFRRKELPRKENLGGGPPYKKTRVVCRTFLELVLLGVKKISIHAHKTGSRYLLGVLFKISDEDPRPFYISPPGNNCR